MKDTHTPRASCPGWGAGTTICLAPVRCIMVSKYMAGFGNERDRMLKSFVRGRSEEAKAVKVRLMWVTCFSPKAR